MALAYSLLKVFNVKIIRLFVSKRKKGRRREGEEGRRVIKRKKLEDRSRDIVVRS